MKKIISIILIACLLTTLTTNIIIASTEELNNLYTYRIESIEREDDKVVVKISGIKESSAQMILAAYDDDGEIINVAIADIEDEKTEYIFNDVPKAELKVFIWDNLKSMKPKAVANGIDKSLSEDSEAVILDYYALEVKFAENDYYNSVTQNIILPTEGENGSDISWEISDTDCVDNDGLVYRQNISKNVVLAATISKGKTSKVKEFELKIIKQDSYIEIPNDHNSLDDLAVYNNNFTPRTLMNESGNIPGFISGSYTDVLVESPYEAILSLNAVKTIMNISDPQNEFVPKNSDWTDDSVTHRIQQVYKGVEVYGRELIVGTDATGRVTSLSGYYEPNINIAIIPSITAESAKTAAIESAGLTESADVSASTPVLIVYALFNHAPTLAYCIEVEGWSYTNEFIGKRIYIDAGNNAGEYLFSEDLISGVGNKTEKTLTDALGNQREVRLTENIFGVYFEDPVRKISIRHQLPIFPSNILSSGETVRVFPTDNLTSTQYLDEVSALANFSHVYDYYENLGRNSFNGKGAPINVVTNFGKLLGWQIMDGAYYSNQLYKTMFFFQDAEDEETGYYRNWAVPLDVVAHEFTHAVENSITSFAKSGESHSLKEAYADIMGELIESKYKDKDEEFWRIGEDLFYNPSQFAYLRNLTNPLDDNTPNKKGGKYWDFTLKDYYTNSTVVSHAAYLMWKNGIRDKEKLANLWYKSLHYLSTESDFYECRKAVIAAASQLKMSIEEIAIIKAAFDEVNIRIDTPSTISGNVYKKELNTAVAAAAFSAFGATDSHEAISNALITVTDEENNVIATTTSDNEGKYMVDSLLAGTYTLSFSKNDYELYKETVYVSDDDLILDAYIMQIESSQYTLSLNTSTITPLTPLEGENTTTFTATVNEVAEKDTVSINVTGVSGITASSTSSYSNGTRTFNVKLTYNGTTAVTNILNELTVGMTINKVANNPEDNIKIPITVYDGKSESRAISVNQNNINAFNTYACTTNGLTRHYQLTENIVLEAPAEGGSNWTQIGHNVVSNFKGSFIGNNHTITGLTINASTAYLGFFGYTGKDSRIENLGLVDIRITQTGNSNYAGGIAGFCGGTITNCYVAGSSSSISSGGNYVGGIVGSNYYDGTVKNCYFDGAIDGNNYIGGIAGSCSGSIENCNTSTSIRSNGDYIGGISGSNNSTSGVIKSCYFDGTIYGGNYVGGVAGQNSGGLVEDCYTDSNVTGKNDTGGIVGANSYDGTVKNCHSSGDVTGQGSNSNFSGVGGVTGYNGSLVEDCSASGNIIGLHAVGGVTGYNFGKTVNSHSTGNVSGIITDNNTGNAIGGVAGNTYTDLSLVENCYATGTISGNECIGGVVGYLKLNSKVKNCYFLGNVSGNTYVDTIVGRNANGIIE